MANNLVVTTASNEAISRGFSVKETKTETGVPVFQIFDTAGEYVCSGTSAEQAWKRAFRRGHLAELADNGRKVRE